MATNYKRYLATEVLNEDRIITYRLLSRAMKVHVNVAKEMLYEFHRNENKKKARSVHATYLVAGSRYEPGSTAAVRKDGDDIVMQSSQPFPSSPPEITVTDMEDDTPILSITLVREEDLEEARKLYESISSIHVYSLGPTKVKDLQTLSDANREVVEQYAGQNGAEYGTITNKNVRKRTSGAPRLAKATTVADVKLKSSAANKEEVKKPEPAKNAESASVTGAQKEPALKGKNSSTNFFSRPANATQKDGKSATPGEASASSAASKPAALKRGNSGSIFASFAKAKPKSTSESSAASSAAQSPASVPEDESMKDVSDDEEEAHVAPPPPPKPRAKKEVAHKEPVRKESAADRKSRTAREAALAKMMDEASDEEPSKPASPVVETPDEEEDVVEEVQLPKREKPEPKEYVEISGGRRRGKRRVMKKKTMRDEEGYLVTKEEPAWESFSEDEPVAKAKPAPSQASQKKKPAAAGKAGQGSIMSFFAKKP